MTKLSAEGRLRLAVKMACVAGAGIAASPAQSQEASSTATELEKVEVTGTRIKRVDVETANPVYTLDRDAIERTGVQTLGQLIQRAPAIVGDATSTNPQVNNGGGTGESTVSLRGLGVPRTLILLDGHRIATLDVNAIPINVVERVEVLKEGASAIYGSDAIGGVVNIITQRNKRDGDFIADYGFSSKHDGHRKDFSVAFGLQGDKGHATIGLTFNQQQAIASKDREFSSLALYLYSGAVFAAGSSRNPQGRVFLPGSFETTTDPGLNPAQRQYDCLSPEAEAEFVAAGGSLEDVQISVARSFGANGSALGDYQCYSGALFAFNYQAVGNVVLTPTKRYGSFLSGEYNINNAVTVFTTFFHNTTTSNSQIAPLPFDAQADNVVIPADNQFNPFGIAFGGISGDNRQMLTRFLAGGDRFFGWQVIVDQVQVGAKGSLFDWRWEALLGYGRIDRTQRGRGYIQASGLQEALAADCTENCVNIFNPLSTPEAIDALLTGYENSYVRQVTNGELNVNGNLFPMPAGDAALAAGLSYRMDQLNAYTDALTRPDPSTLPNLSCGLSQEACTSAAVGHIRGADAYVEFLFPLLRDMPAVKALNLNIGDRYSKYKSFGGTNTVTVAMEYRPTGDVLARANFAQVYRIPTIEDLYLPQKANNPTFKDPCTFIDEPEGTDPNHDLACENVPRNGTFRQSTSQITSVVQGNPNLKPEKGEVVTFGVVYDSSLLPGFSTAVDFWRYTLSNYIFDVGDVALGLDPNITANVCFQTGDPELCGLIHRGPNGELDGAGFVDAPAFNLGDLTAQGVDAGFKYNTKKLSFGRIRATFDATYLHKYDVAPKPGAKDLNVAGTFNRQFGTYPRWRGIATLGWEGFGADVLLTERYIGAFSNPDADAIIPGVNVDYNDSFYTNLEIGYSIEPSKTRVAVGVDNITDRTPPIMFQNNTLNGNVDVNTFDTVGRYVWFRLNQRF